MRGDLKAIEIDVKNRCNEYKSFSFENHTEKIYYLYEHLSYMFEQMNIHPMELNTEIRSGNLWKLSPELKLYDVMYQDFIKKSTLNDTKSMFCFLQSYFIFKDKTLCDITELPYTDAACFLDLEYVDVGCPNLGNNKEEYKKNECERPIPYHQVVETLKVYITTHLLNTMEEIKSPFIAYLKPNITIDPITSEYVDWHWFEDLTGISSKFLLENGKPIDEIIGPIKEYINNRPLFIKKSDAYFLECDVYQRTDKHFFLGNYANGLCIVQQHMPKIFEALGIDVKHINTCSGALYKLIVHYLDQYRNKHTVNLFQQIESYAHPHSVERNVKSMALFIYVYFKKFSEIRNI